MSRALTPQTIRRWKIGLLACCGILLAATQSPQKTDMAGAKANVSHETIEGLVRDVACPIQNLDNHATSMGAKCVQDCVKGGSPLVILTKDDRLYFPISARMPDRDQRQVLMPFVGKYVRASGIVFERTGTSATITEYGYETIANKSLDAGLASTNSAAGQAPTMTEPPRPASLGMLAFGFEGLSLWQREETLASR